MIADGLRGVFGEGVAPWPDPATMEAWLRGVVEGFVAASIGPASSD